MTSGGDVRPLGPDGHRKAATYRSADGWTSEREDEEYLEPCGPWRDSVEADKASMDGRSSKAW